MDILEVDSMGGGIDGSLGISSTLSLQKSPDLEKTQVELRKTFNAAEKYRRELEYLQKGGNPLDLIYGIAASVSGQSTSLTDQRPEQFVTSEAKGSFAITASPLGDSVGSSGRLGVHLGCESNSADNLVLFDGDNKFPKVERKSVAPVEHYSQLDSGQHARKSSDSAALELPKKAYRRRVRSKPNRDGARSSFSRDVKGLVVAANDERNGLSNFNSKITNLVSNNRLDTELDGDLAVETTLGGVHGSLPAISDTNDSQNSRMNQHDSTKVLDSESSGTQKAQSLDAYNENELPRSPRNVNFNGKMERNLASNEVSDKEGNNLVKENEIKILNNSNSDFHSCHGAHNDEGSLLKEDEGLKGSVLESTLSVRGPNDVSEQPECSQNTLNLATKEHEDFILKEAQIIEEKYQRISELYVSTLPVHTHQNSHWDLVLEEMSWLANDFAQERLWKVSAAAQVSRRVAFASQIRYQQRISSWRQKEVAQTLGRYVMEFWHTTEVKCKDLKLQCLKTDAKQGLQGYAMRFLEYNNTHARCSTAQASSTHDMISDAGIISIASDDNLTEENLVYTVPPGAIEAYRKSVESHLLQCERARSGIQEEVDTSCYNAIADNAYEDNDAETRAYYLPGAFEGSKASKAIKKRRKDFKFYTARSYEMGAGLPFKQSSENDIGSTLNVPLPVKHVRTASSQRVIGPFSGDTGSFQEEQNGGAQMANKMEADSVVDYEKQLRFDSVEVSDRPIKKKKTKHPGSSFNNRWQSDSNFQNDQKDHSERRLDAHQFDSKGSNGLYIQPNIKKLKIRQSFDDFTPSPHSVQSPVTSQTSSMSNPKKIMELLVRDRNKKSKTLKMPAGQPGSGSPWSLFEEQSLVVLVHDMGPNWELISDVFNSNLQSKCIFRSSKECEERHKMLMDISTSEVADDFKPSQPYPSTLPGIPEGSARQLYQLLQGPMEEQTLKSHFEKIIKLGKKQYNRRKQNDNQDPKQLQLPHESHNKALSSVTPNNRNGGRVLTPLDLCDAIASTPDVPPVGCQGSSSTSVVPGSSNLARGNDFSSASVPLNPSIRDGRCGNPKTGTLPKDDQQRMQQYNHMGQGVRMLPSGNNVGAMSAINRGMPMARPPFNGVASPSMLNPVNMQARVGSGQGSSIVRPRDSMHLMRPNHNNDNQRQLPPISHGQSSQGVPHPAFGTPFIKERQLQHQRALQHQQFPTTNTMMPHVQPPKSQLPISSPQTQSQSQKPPLLPPRGMIMNPQTVGNQILKQPHQSNQKLMNLSQVKPAQKMVNNRLINSSEPPTSKLQMSPPQTSSTVASSEPFWASS